jgi:hypothetical protein
LKHSESIENDLMGTVYRFWRSRKTKLVRFIIKCSLFIRISSW